MRKIALGLHILVGGVVNQPKPSPRRKLGCKWQGVLDWSLRDDVLAACYPLTLSTIKSYRRIYAPETLKRFRAAKKVDWDKVDFSKAPSKICKETGCALRTVMQQKRRRSVPKTPFSV